MDTKQAVEIVVRSISFDFASQTGLERLEKLGLPISYSEIKPGDKVFRVGAESYYAFNGGQPDGFRTNASTLRGEAIDARYFGKEEMLAALKVATE